MRTRAITLEQFLYLAAFLLGLGVRLYRLGAAPLSDFEAGWALQAMDIARGGQPVLGPQPAYAILTSLLFSLFPDTNFLARLLPALAGSALVWLPCLLRAWMGESAWLRKAGLLMAFGLALDPGLVVHSRLAGSVMPAVVFSLLGLALLLQRRMILFGVAAGLALLSGPAVLHGGLVLGVAWLLERGWKALAPREEAEVQAPQLVLSSAQLRQAILAFVATLLAAGLLFMRLPQGLGALAASLPTYLGGWTAPSGVPALRLPLIFLLYQPLVVIFGLVAAARGWFSAAQNERVATWFRYLSLWALVALLLAMLYPARQAGDLTWALVPGWALASMELARHLPAQADRLTRLAAGALSGLLFILAVVIWFNVLGIARYQANYNLYFAIIGGAFLLGLVSILLVGAGWSVSAARLGAVWGFASVLFLGMIANTWGMAQLRPNSAQELWSIMPGVGQARELNQTLESLSIWETGLRSQVDVVVQVDSPALRWALRDFPAVRYTSTLAVNEAPALVITWKGAESPVLAESYRGMDFVWRLTDSSGWQGILPANFLNWLVFRQGTLTQEWIILWARADLFPSSNPQAPVFNPSPVVP